jgi:exodeoxyribonuclease-1
MPTPTLLWYDYETTGTDTVRDRPLQFAALRTDPDLTPLGDGETWYCAPAPDVLPQPEACLITGITPQDAARTGVIEAEFAGRVHALLAEPGTCSVGYNSLRFDDEINRNLFYRNFFDPYEHAWRGGNARWDILDLVRACYALRPEGITWPTNDAGVPVFKLDQLAPANHLKQDHAHDALCDVEATLALARLIRARHPKLYAWAYRLRDKRFVASQLAARLVACEPIVHVSGRYGAARGCLALAVPLCEHPTHGGSYVVADLAVDPAGWVDLDPEDLHERMFTRREDLPEDVERPPLKEVHANRSPFLAPIETLHGVDAARIGLDVDRCLANLEVLRASVGLGDRVRRVFAEADGRFPAREDAECRLYASFPADADKRKFARVRATPASALGATDFGFEDARYDELLFRYRARNWPDTLDADEHARWSALVRTKLTTGTETTTLTLDAYFATIARLRGEMPPGPGQAVLDRLQAWGEGRRAEFGL